jgi:hypothetical protein
MARMTAASVPITFADGTTYQFSPLTDKSIDEIDEWLQAKVIETARHSLKPDTPKEEREETLRIAVQESQKVSFLNDDGLLLLATVPGMTFLCWLALRREHPEVTQEQLRDKLSDASNILIVNEKFAHVNKREPLLKKVRRAKPKMRMRRR